MVAGTAEEIEALVRGVMLWWAQQGGPEDRVAYAVPIWGYGGEDGDRGKTVLEKLAPARTDMTVMVRAEGGGKVKSLDEVLKGWKTSFVLQTSWECA